VWKLRPSVRGFESWEGQPKEIGNGNARNLGRWRIDDNPISAPSPRKIPDMAEIVKPPERDSHSGIDGEAHESLPWQKGIVARSRTGWNIREVANRLKIPLIRSDGTFLVSWTS
jgi:hypothetical protein